MAEPFPGTVDQGFTHAFVKYYNQLKIVDVGMPTENQQLGSNRLRLQVASILASVLSRRNLLLAQ